MSDKTGNYPPESNYQYETVERPAMSSRGIRILACPLSSDTVILPDQIAGLPVVALGDKVFFGSRVKSITLPGTLVNIGAHAFQNCQKLEQIQLPDSIRKIDDYTFAGCSHLHDVALPHNLEEIGSHAFSGCRQLTRINIPAPVTIIRSDAFFDCRNLQEIVLPEGLREIGTVDRSRPAGRSGGAFENCVNLASITIPDSVVVMGNNTFKGCVRLKRIEIPRHIMRI